MQLPTPDEHNNVSLSKFESMLKTNNILFFDADQFLTSPVQFPKIPFHFPWDDWDYWEICKPCPEGTKQVSYDAAANGQKMLPNDI